MRQRILLSGMREQQRGLRSSIRTATTQQDRKLAVGARVILRRNIGY